jgi:hypothetical protein
MKYEKLEQHRTLLARNLNRGQLILRSAENAEGWPIDCNRMTIMFAAELAIHALDLVDRSAAAIGMHGEDLNEPLKQEDFADFLTDTEDADNGLNAEEVFTARLALARRLNSAAGDLLHHAEACLEGLETLDGEPIHRSPLHDK